MVHNEKSPLGGGLKSEEIGFGEPTFLVFINLLVAGDGMHKYSNPSTQKQRVLYE